MYNGILYDQQKHVIDKVILICSPESYNDAVRFKNALQYEVIIEQCGAVNMIKINQHISKVRKMVTDTDTVTLNLVGGTKSWSLWLYTLFLDQPQAQFILLTQHAEVWDLKKRTKEQFDFDPIAQLHLYCNSSLQLGTPLTDYTDTDKKVMHQIESLREGLIPIFNKLTFDFSPIWKADLQKKQQSTFQLEDGSYVKWKRAERRGEDDMASIVLHNKQGGEKSADLSSPHALSLLFSSGWFEYKVALLLQAWQGAKELWLNTRIKALTGQDLNELDIIVNAGNKLLFVECKVAVKNSTDIDKFNTVYKTYGGASKGLFIVKENLTQEVREKCEKYNILTYSLKANNNNPERLYKLLDEYMNSTNK